MLVIRLIFIEFYKPLYFFIKYLSLVLIVNILWPVEFTLTSKGHKATWLTYYFFCILCYLSDISNIYTFVTWFAFQMEISSFLIIVHAYYKSLNYRNTKDKIKYSCSDNQGY